MSKKLKLGKISITVFLTALIWVWADLAQDEQFELSSPVTVTATKPSDPNSWVTLETPEGTLRNSLTFKRVVLQGPASRVADVERRSNKRELDLNLYLVPEQMGLTETMTMTRDALSFLKQSKEIRQLGLTVESCDPNTLTIQVRRLRIEDLAVECIDEKGTPLVAETLEPSRVRVRVPPGGASAARVRLTAEEQKQAREAPLEKLPYVDLADGQRSQALEKVKVKLPPTDDLLQQHSVYATLGFCMSRNLQDRYKVELRTDPTIEPVAIRATMAAFQEYEKRLFHAILYIDDTDKPGQDYTRKVAFNFPEEYVRRGEIRLDPLQPDVEVQFRLVPITPPTPAPSGPME